MFEKGTVVLVPFPYTDLSAQKVRPAVILSRKNTGGDVTVAFISSRVLRKAHIFDIVINSTNAGFNNTGLKINSVIKVNKLATLDKKITLGELSTLDTSTREAVDRKLKLFFGL